MEDLLGVAVRVTVTYLYVLAVVRVTGKRTIGQMSLPDAASAFIVGDMFDDLFFAEVPAAQGLLAVGTVILLHLIVVYGAYRSREVAWLVESPAALMIKAGRMVPEGLKGERVRPEEVQAQLREKGIGRLEEVGEAFQEPHDHMSAIRSDTYRPVQKRDRAKLEELLR